MSVKALASFKSKCKKLFKIQAQETGLHKSPPSSDHENLKQEARDLFRGLFFSRREPKGMDRLVQGKSYSERVSDATMLFPSPLTPAYVRAGGKSVASSSLDEVEDSCRSFENYLAEMIVEEGKSRELRDVEELLYCWSNLNCPVFIGLVSRFYGELWKDLFLAQTDEVDHRS